MRLKNSVGVVIPTYNREHMILEALNSVGRQTLLPTKVVVVDDGSEDYTSKIIELWVTGANPEFKFEYIYKKNGGPGSSRNVGIKNISECEWVAFLDSDDLWPPDHLERLINVVKYDEEFVGCSSEFNEVYFNAEGEMLSQRLFVHGKTLNPSVQGPLAIMISAPQTSCAMIKTSIAENVGGFNETMMYAEDKLFFMEVSCFGKWGRAEGAPIIYRNIVKAQIGAKQLSDGPHQNSRVTYARLLDKALRKYLKSDIIWHQGVAWALWKGWYRAGKRLEQKKHLKWAGWYYLKAAKLRPFSKASLRLCSVYWRRNFLK